jgi:hypothetical protein
MHEKLNEQIEAMDEKVIRIINGCLDNLEKSLPIEKGEQNAAHTGNAMKFVGEGLKALAEGLESYRAVTIAIKKDATPRESCELPTEPVVGGQGYTGPC